MFRVIQDLFAAMEDDNSNPFRRMSSRTRKVAPRMTAALASSDNRTQVYVSPSSLKITFRF